MILIFVDGMSILLRLKLGRLLFLTALLPLSVVAEVKLSIPDVEAKVIDNVYGHLRLSSETCDSPKWKVRREFAAINKEAAQGLRVYGYYSPEIKKQLSWTDKCWLAAVDIDAGKPVIVTKLDITISGEASEDQAFIDFQQNLQLLLQKPLFHKDYDKAKNSLLNLASERGYFSAQLLTSQLRVNRQQQSAVFVFKLDSGPRFSIGEIDYSEHPLNVDFLHRLAKVKQGDAFTADAMIRLDRNLADSGYFQSVDVNLKRDQQHDNQMPLDVDLVMKKRHAWKAGVGVTSDTGARISGGYANRLINDKGHQFTTDLQLSQAESEWVSAYTIPGDDPHKEKYDLGLSVKHEDNDTYVTDNMTLTARQRLFHDRWSEVRTLDLLYETYDVSDQSDDAWLLIPGTRWQYQYADNPLKVHQGYRVSLGFKGAVEGLISTTSFLQMSGSAKVIYRFADAGRISARGEIGMSWTDEIDSLPVSLRFFAGGDNSVRGYEYESLGPVDDNGEVIGGDHLITTSIEYEHPVSGDDWWGAVFVDAGNAFNLDDKGIDLKVGYGAGVRWFSPVGKIRFDVAFPEEGDISDYQLHFSFGADL